MPRPRIVHITTVHNVHDTRVLYRECVSLARAGYDITLIACAENAFNCKGVKVIPLRKPGSRLNRMTITALSALRKALVLNPTIYHFHDPELAPWMGLLRFRTNRIIFDVHEKVASNIDNRLWIPGFVRPIVKRLAQWTLPVLMRSFHIIFAEDSYPKEYPWIHNYTLLRNFPELDSFPTDSNFARRVPFTIAYIGSISESRGIIDLLDAASLLQKSGHEIGLLLIGRDDLGSGRSIQELVSARNLNNVEIIGYTPQPTAMALIRTCHVGFAVLHRIPNYVDSYPTKIFEYMGCELPFITSDFPLYRGIVDKWKCGFAIEPSNPSVIASTIGKLIANEELRKLMGTRGKEAVATEYNWASEERNLLKLYDSLN